jgi:anti-anti-sigma factor
MEMGMDMDMKINIECGSGGVIAKLSGRLDANTSPSFKKAFDEMGEDAFKSDVVLDFSAVKYISSAGLRELLVLQRKIKAAQGSLGIENLGSAVREVFDMTGFSAIFNI